MPSCPLVRLMRCAVIFGLKPPSESASFLNHHQLFQRMVTLTPHPPVAQESQMLLGNYSQHGGRTGNTSSIQSLADPTPFKKIIINCCFLKQPGFSHHLSQFNAGFLPTSLLSCQYILHRVSKSTYNKLHYHWVSKQPFMQTIHLIGKLRTALHPY